MSDDIVTRLRGKRTEFDNWLNDCEGKHSFGHDESIWSDAADEIERLQADRDRWELTVTSTAKHYKELLEKVSAERDYWQQLAEERADG